MATEAARPPRPGEWIPKGWGGEHIIQNDEAANYCAKRLLVVAGKRFSYHYHLVKHETFYILGGLAKLYLSPEGQPADEASMETAKVSTLSTGGILVLPPGRVHRVHALEDTWIFETSTFDRPEDSIRIEKGD